ncbi:dual specificity protein kinase Ttk isoform X1 [Paramormyrops kingsleyae]|uniref:dual specificity protein kinase Ttk isoform X1 n=2 Tax=Paramormyrops kingsleyae TaxID=1676925 RepID=UPI003B97AA5B
MENEEKTDRMLQFALLCQKLKNIKSTFLSDDDISPKQTDDIYQVLSSNSPEACLTYLVNLEKRGNPQTDPILLTKLMDGYTRVFSCLPLDKHSQNESYAKMLVRFAELKAIQDPDEAQDSFIVARSNSKMFAFVHIAHAQFELSRGNVKKSTSILQRAFWTNAKPTELLETALQNLKAGKAQLLPQEEKENIAWFGGSADLTPTLSVTQAPTKSSRPSQGTGDLHLGGLLCSSMDQKSSFLEDPLPGWRSSSQRKKPSNMPGRVPLVPLPIPEDDDDDDGRPVKKNDGSGPSSLNWQASGAKANPVFSLSSSKKSSGDGDSYTLLNRKPSIISPEPRPWEDPGSVDSTTTLLHRPERKASLWSEDNTESIKQVLSSNSPETCRTYLVNLEKRGNPQTDVSLLTKLMDGYTRVFSSLPLAKHSQNESYAKMLVRFAELKAIQDPEEAQDNFIVARSNSKMFAFVHIAHAQFELSQGSAKKSALILHRAFGANAKPTELLETALQNLKAGKAQLLPLEDKEKVTGSSAGALTETRDTLGCSQGGASSSGPYRPMCKEISTDWKIPARINRHPSAEEKPSPFISVPAPAPAPAPPLLPATRGSSTLTCQTPNYKTLSATSYATPVQKNPPQCAPSTVPRGPAPSQQPCTPLNQMSHLQQTPQGLGATFSNDSITIKGKQFFILKMIGRGGSSKVYQVLDHRKQLFAVKYVNLEEADIQTVASYKNEIEHLNHLQQYSDQIIKLYDYEITNSYIYMLMECGNLDLNTWLRNRKEVNPLERKLYWKNMLEAVQTIHRHGIVHSDLKPANFVIVNATLKLIDFGIANRIQPDVTSIMKDSQLGTLSYMPPEAIKDTSKGGKPGSKISPKGDVWSLGCILYYMTYGKTPFQSITNQISKLHAIIDPSHQIDFPDVAEKDLLDVLKRCLVRNPKERISIAELLSHPYLQLQPLPSPNPPQPANADLQRILNELAALQSPNSIARAASNLARMCNSGKRLDVSECLKASSQTSGKM